MCSLQQTVTILHVLVERYSLDATQRKNRDCKFEKCSKEDRSRFCAPREWRQNEAVCRHRESRHVSITENVREASGVYAFRVTWLWRLIEFLSATWYAHRCPRVDTLTVARQPDANSFSRVNESFDTPFFFSFLSFFHELYRFLSIPHARDEESRERYCVNCRPECFGRRILQKYKLLILKRFEIFELWEIYNFFDSLVFQIFKFVSVICTLFFRG